MTILLKFRPATVVMWINSAHGFGKDVNRDLKTLTMATGQHTNKNK